MGRGYASYQQSTPTWVLTPSSTLNCPMKLATSVPVPKDNQLPMESMPIYTWYFYGGKFYGIEIQNGK
jgi:hypothetical protein